MIRLAITWGPPENRGGGVRIFWGRSRAHGEEVRVNAKAVRPALLRVKLRAHHVAARGRCRGRVLTRRDGVLARLRCERMHEVEIRALLHAFPQPRRPRLRHSAPPDHGHVLAPLHRGHASWQQSEALMAAALGRLLEEQLIAETYAEQRLARAGQLDHPAAEAALGQALSRGAERSDARQHEARGALEGVAIRRYLNLRTRVHQRALDRAQVADAVVDDRNHWGVPEKSRWRGADFLGSLVNREVLWTTACQNRRRRPLPRAAPGQAP